MDLELRRHSIWEVRAYQFEHKCTTEEACKAVGINPRTYYRWIATDPDSIEVFREMMVTGQKSAFVDMLSSIPVGLETLSKRLASPDINTAEALAIIKLFMPIMNEFADTYHAQPGAEDEAAAFLKKGVKTKQSSSRLQVNIEIVEPDILDLDAADLPEESSSDSPQSQPE